MRRISFLMIPLLAIGLLAESALSQMRYNDTVQSEREPVHARGGGRWHRSRGMERMKEQLELSDEQAKQIQNILREARKKSIRIRADLQVARIELGELVTRETVDKEMIDAKLKTISQLREKRLRLRTDVVLATREILNAEQLENADQWFLRVLSGRSGRIRRWHR